MKIDGLDSVNKKTIFLSTRKHKTLNNKTVNGVNKSEYLMQMLHLSQL